jgi:hypothetical protein
VKGFFSRCASLYTVAMGKTWIEGVFWPEPPEPPRMLYFEKRENGVILSCQIAVYANRSSVRSDDEDIGSTWEWGGDSEQLAIEYVEQLGYARAADWRLPPAEDA